MGWAQVHLWVNVNDPCLRYSSNRLLYTSSIWLYWSFQTMPLPSGYTRALQIATNAIEVERISSLVFKTTKYQISSRKPSVPWTIIIRHRLVCLFPSSHIFPPPSNSRNRNASILNTNSFLKGSRSPSSLVIEFQSNLHPPIYALLQISIISFSGGFSPHLFLRFRWMQIVRLFFPLFFFFKISNLENGGGIKKKVFQCSKFIIR